MYINHTKLNSSPKKAKTTSLWFHLFEEAKIVTGRAEIQNTPQQKDCSLAVSQQYSNIRMNK